MNNTNQKTEKFEAWLNELNIIGSILNANEIKWFLDMGTLLGSVRDGSFIPWDNDIDIGIVETSDSHEKLMKVCETSHTQDFHVNYCDQSIALSKMGIVEINIAIYKKDHDYCTYKYVIPNRMASARYSLSQMAQGRYFFSKPSSDKAHIKSIALRSRLFAATITTIANIFLPKLEYKQIRVNKKYLEKQSSTWLMGRSFPAPFEKEDYLRQRYGEQWRTPTKKWTYFEDDKSINH